MSHHLSVHGDEARLVEEAAQAARHISRNPARFQDITAIHSVLDVEAAAGVVGTGKPTAR